MTRETTRRCLQARLKRVARGWFSLSTSTMLVVDVAVVLLDDAAGMRRGGFGFGRELESLRREGYCHHWGGKTEGEESSSRSDCLDQLTRVGAGRSPSFTFGMTTESLLCTWQQVLKFILARSILCRYCWIMGHILMRGVTEILLRCIFHHGAQMSFTRGRWKARACCSSTVRL